MICSEAKKNLHPYLDDELDPASAVSVADHLRTCASCAAEFGRHKAVARLTKAAMRPEPGEAIDLSSLRRTLELEAQSTETKRRRRLLAWGAPALAAAVVLAWMLVPLMPGVGKSERYVYHVNHSDNAATALANIAFHLEAAPKADFVVVTHNEGVDFLLKGAADDTGVPYQQRVAELKQRGVQFRVCQNTLRVRQIPKQNVIEQAAFVPSGIAEVGRLQVEEGYAYLKP